LIFQIGQIQQQNAFSQIFTFFPHLWKNFWPPQMFFQPSGQKLWDGWKKHK